MVPSSWRRWKASPAITPLAGQPRSTRKRYKNPAIRGFAAASGAFLENPPEGFASAPLLTPRGLLIIGREDQADAVTDQFTPDQIRDGVAETLTVDDAVDLVPCLNRDYLGAAMLVPAASDIDVNGLHRGFLPRPAGLA